MRHKIYGKYSFRKLKTLLSFVIYKGLAAGSLGMLKSEGVQNSHKIAESDVNRKCILRIREILSRLPRVSPALQVPCEQLLHVICPE